MILLSSVYTTLIDTYYTKNWSYRDIASGHLAGNKVGRIFSMKKPSLGLFPWVGTVLDHASIYFKARDLGLFEKMPALRKPFIWGAAIVACINLKELFSAEQTRDEKRSESLIWNLTPKVNAIGLTAIAVFEFPEQPMKTATFFASGTISFLSRGHFGKAILPLRASLWLARANTFWTGSWTERAFTVFKVAKKIIRWD